MFIRGGEDIGCFDSVNGSNASFSHKLVHGTLGNWILRLRISSS